MAALVEGSLLAKVVYLKLIVRGYYCFQKSHYVGFIAIGTYFKKLFKRKE